MPALPSVPGVIRIDKYFSIGEDSNGKCREFMSYSGSAPSNSELATLASLWRSSWASGVAAYQSDQAALTSVVITDLSSPTAAIGEDTTVVTGGASAWMLTADSCFLESRPVARRYRGGHPRIYWPLGTTADALDPQKWTTGFVAACGGALNALGAAVRAGVWSGGGTLTSVSVSYYTGFTVHTGTTGRARNVSTVRPVPLVDTLLSSHYQQGIASQRKRLLRLA